MYKYKAFVTRVLDGDTYDMSVNLGFGIKIDIRVRLNGIDTPETWRPKTDSEREHGEKATKFVMNLISNKTVEIETYKLGIYGRYSASVQLPDGRSLVSLLKMAGFEKRNDYI